jgi:hypothetical protein
MKSFLSLVMAPAVLGALVLAAGSGADEGKKVPATQPADSPKAQAASPASSPASSPSSQAAPAAGTGTLVGKIVDANGAPVEGANISLCLMGPAGPDANTQFLGRAKSGKDGAFSIEGMAPGTQRTLTVRRPSPGRVILSADVKDIKIEAGKTLDLGAVKVGVLRLVPQVRGGPEPFVP